MRRALGVVLAATALASAVAAADDVDVEAVSLAAGDDGITLNADFAFELNSRLEDALDNGVPLYFVVEFEIFRPRWYWFDEKIGAAELSLRLSFHALTRTFRVSTGALHQSYTKLDDAVRALSRVRGWHVLPRGALKPDTVYHAYVRMRLDTAQLPKPFQVSALASRDWTLASRWRKWDVSGAITASEAVR
jgi:hypothetical protein